MPNTRPRLRRTLAFGVILIVACVFLFRLVDLQIIQAAALNKQSQDKRAVPVSIPSRRGDIVDRNQAVLATTDERYDVQLSPKNTRINGGKFWIPDSDGGFGTQEVTSEQMFAKIGKITGQSGSEIKKIVDDALAKNKKSDFAYVKRAIDLTQLNELKKLHIPWLTFDTHHTRIYPNGAVAGNITGFAGADEAPQSGIELSQNACLKSVDGSERYERGADGVPLPGSVVVEKNAVDGGTVQLTIDRDLQWQAQQAINEQTQKVSAKWGLLVIMNVKTGELVAVAEDNSVDPNDVDTSDPAKREARSFVYAYEPGSTFKTITASALINEGAATPLSQNMTPDYWEPEPSVRFGDSVSHPPMPWTLTGILVQSSNVGISSLGSLLTPEVREDYLRRFGIGTATHAGMPLEDPGLLYPVDQWDRQTSYNTMFGQGLSSTIVQTAGVYQTIANGGERVAPKIVQSCTKADGTRTKPDYGHNTTVVTEHTSKEVMRMLETVVSDGWYADMISIPGYRLAGKTGTAEQVDPETGAYRSDFIHSFVGIFPAEAPQYVAAASIAFPTSGDGGVASIMAFKSAAEATIRTFRIPPSTGTFEPYPSTY